MRSLFWVPSPTQPPRTNYIAVPAFQFLAWFLALGIYTTEGQNKQFFKLPREHIYREEGEKKRGWGWKRGDRGEKGWEGKNNASSFYQSWLRRWWCVCVCARARVSVSVCDSSSWQFSRDRPRCGLVSRRCVWSGSIPSANRRSTILTSSARCRPFDRELTDPIF